MPSPRPDRNTVLAAAASLAALAALFLVLRLPLIDDAYIALTYSRTLATDGTWGVFPGHMANTATEPLNVLVLALLGSITGSFPFAARALAVVCLWTVYLCAADIGRRTLGSRALGIAALAAVALNPLLLSAIGLSPALVAALLAVASWALVAERWKLLGVMLGLLVLARMETGLLALIVLATCRWTGAPFKRVLGWSAVVALPWFAYSWTTLGSVVPDTFFLKTSQKWGGGMTFGSGIAFYLDVYPIATGAAFACAPLGLLTLLGPAPIRRLAALLAGYAVATFLAYLWLAPPPYHWYFLQQAVPLALCGALGIATAVQRYGRRSLTLAAIPALLFVTVCVDRGLPLDEPFIHTNWANEARYEEIGRALAAETEPGEAIRFECELGTLAFYSNRYCVDALSDMAHTNLVVWQGKYGHSEAARPLLEWNFKFRPWFDGTAATAWTLTQSPERAAGADERRVWNTSTRWFPAGHLTLVRDE